MVCFFVNLPDELRADLITRWLNMLDVYSLERSLCSAHRPNWTKLASSPLCLFPELGAQLGSVPSFLRWAAHRRIKFKKMEIVVEDEATNCAAKAFLRYCGFRTEHWCITGDETEQSLLESAVEVIHNTLTARVVGMMARMRVVANLFCLPLVASIVMQRTQFIKDRSLCINKQCTQLVHLHLSHSNIDDAMMSTIIASTPNVSRLHLGHCVLLTDESAGAIASGWARLRVLELIHTEFSELGMLALVRRCSELTRICVSNYSTSQPAITDMIVLAIVQHCPKVEHMLLCCLVGLTVQAIYEVAQRCPRMLNVGFVGVEDATDDAIRALVDGCPLLQHLEMPNSSSPELTVAALEYVAMHCKHLQLVKYLLQYGKFNRASKNLFPSSVHVRVLMEDHFDEEGRYLGPPQINSV